MPRKPSKADLALSHRLADAQIKANPRKIEAARQAGLLEDANHPGQGQGRGSKSIRSDNETERAIEAFTLLTRHGPHRQAVLAMFLKGEYPLTEGKVKIALTGGLVDLGKWIESHAGPASDAFTAAYSAATWAAGYAAKSKQFRELRGRLREHYTELRAVGTRGFVSARDQLADLITDVLLVPLSGKTTSPEATHDLLSLTGVTNVLDDPYTGERQPPTSTTTFHDRLPQLSAANLANIVDASTLSQLEQARDDTTEIAAFAAAYGAFLAGLKQHRSAFAWLTAANVGGRAIAYVIPAMVGIRAWRPDELDEFLATAREWTPGFNAFATLLATLPDPLIHNLKTQQHNLDAATKSALARHITEFKITHPEQYLEVVRERPELGSGVRQ